ncbi:hypothetical protein HHI36_014843 [Cryptolaemus montrouzieri]|uniref:Uncharacterized protein n=1 Tax=Cryptolaemus montrouzieri TaxID=559131 RepID=A0ABD2N4B1_9CUCU
MSFANRVENCYIKLLSTLDESMEEEKRKNYTEILQDQALYVFLMGLNRDLAVVVKARSPITLEDAIRIAVNEEQETRKKTVHSITFVQTCSDSGFRRNKVFCVFSKSGSKLFTKLKDRAASSSVPHCVYSVNCKDCDTALLCLEENLSKPTTTCREFDNENNVNVDISNPALDCILFVFSVTTLISKNAPFRRDAICCLLFLNACPGPLVGNRHKATSVHQGTRIPKYSTVK